MELNLIELDIKLIAVKRESNETISKF
jgi:hypothetical protein